MRGENHVGVDMGPILNPINDSTTASPKTRKSKTALAKETRISGTEKNEEERSGWEVTARTGRSRHRRRRRDGLLVTHLGEGVESGGPSVRVQACRRDRGVLGRLLRQSVGGTCGVTVE